MIFKGKHTAENTAKDRGRSLRREMDFSDDEEDSDKCSGSEHPHDDKDRFMPNSANECLSNNGLQVDSTSVGISRTGSSYDDAIVLD